VEAGLGINDRMRVRADGEGRLIFERIQETLSPTAPRPPG
jgi:hypothetical protein